LYLVHFAAINVAKGKGIKQVAQRINMQFLAKQFGPARAYTFQIFNSL